ncbi:hypothetical protein J1N35_004912 [Gossypium stocksii]|uniref:Uncharacterized protein n=1 Tax=Gossypium stocksii TaxID=47602 RepID=A0A9D3WCW3_9ROSI|nr:hypothetical protein J1N35_004912 [Gossypium stocksii]
MTAGSFAFTNCVGGYGSSLASLNMTIGSFTFVNYVWGCDSSPVSLNMIVGSFALANCAGAATLRLKALI